MNIQHLTPEILIKIFSYLKITDLLSLRATCKRFQEIIDTWILSLLPNIPIFVTKQEHQYFINRSYRKLSSFDKLRISHNWKTGTYRERKLLHSKKRYLSWLQLQADFLWTSQGNRIRGYQRNKYGIDFKRAPRIIKPQSASDVYRFALKDNHILAGQEDGSLFLWSIDDCNFIFDTPKCHDIDIAACDLSNDILASGSSDCVLKIWRRPKEHIEKPELLHTLQTCDRIWSLSLCEENESLLAVGTSGITSRSVISIYDTLTYEHLTQFNSDEVAAGILDLKWESPSTFWSCSYDMFLRKWDLRIGKPVLNFLDPCLATLYCFHLDYSNSIITGAQTNGRAVLWDQRMANYVQIYFMDSCKGCDKSSPIYSLSFDAEFLFTNTDRNLNVLNFSTYDKKKNDYSGIFDSRNSKLP